MPTIPAPQLVADFLSTYMEQFGELCAAAINILDPDNTDEGTQVLQEALLRFPPYVLNGQEIASIMASHLADLDQFEAALADADADNEEAA